MIGKGMLSAALLGSILLSQDPVTAKPADEAPADAKDLSNSKKAHNNTSFKSGPAPVLAPHQLPTKGKYDIYAFWDSTDPYAFNPRVMGHPGNERIICNHEELFVRFWDRKIEMVADIAHLLPEVRRLIDEGKEREAYSLADTEAKRQLAEKGRIFRKGVVPHPAFDLHIQHGPAGEPSDYRRQLDLETGEALTRWRNGDGGVEQRVFSSRPHDVNVVQLKGTGGRALDVTLFLKEVPRSSKRIYGVSMKDYAKPPKISAAAMGNLPECAKSYFNYIKGMLPGWRLNARRYLGCRGFLAGNYTDPENGFLVHLGNRMGWMYWPGGGGWNLHPFYDYALLTGDREFMKKEVLPLYLEMADFYEDYMVKGKDGFYHIYPGISPENAPRGRVKTLKDCTFDLAVAREVFRVLIELGEQFGLDGKKISKWKDCREKIAPYRVNKDGALAEWAPAKYGEFYKHRHLSHLIMVYPWWEFSLPGAAPGLREAAAVALDRRFGFDANETHGLMHVSLMAARLKDVEKVRTNLHRLATRNYFYGNMATSCRINQRISNLDASLSLPRLIMEMLVFSRPGHIELLPAWPRDYPDGSIAGVLVRGGHRLDMTWAGGKVVSATIHAGRDDRGTIVHGAVEKPFEFEAGRSYRLDGQLQIQSIGR